MVDVKVYNIDDKEYMVINELDDNDKHYLLLSNKEDEDDILFRKVDNNSLVPLENEDEVVRVLQLFDETN